MEARYGHRDEELSPEIVEIFPWRSQQAGRVAEEQDGGTFETLIEDWEGESVSPSPTLLRGRREVRVGSRRKERRGRRPRTAARAPSDELWTVMEEGEGEEVASGLGLGIVVEGVDGR